MLMLLWLTFFPRRKCNILPLSIFWTFWNGPFCYKVGLTFCSTDSRKLFQITTYRFCKSLSFTWLEKFSNRFCIRILLEIFFLIVTQENLFNLADLNSESFSKEKNTWKSFIEQVKTQTLNLYEFLTFAS